LALAAAALSLGLIYSGAGQAQTSNEAECRQIWQQADTQNEGYLTGSKAQAYRQAMAGIRGGASGGAGGGMSPQSGSPMGGAQGMAPSGGGTASSGSAAGSDRLMRSEFLAACMQNPQAFRNVGG
jgi:hypothetical protein